VPFEDFAGTLPAATCLCHWRTALNVVHDSISGAMCHGVLWPVLALGVVLMPFLLQQHSQPAPITVQQAFPSRTFVGCAWIAWFLPQPLPALVVTLHTAQMRVTAPRCRQHGERWMTAHSTFCKYRTCTSVRTTRDAYVTCGMWPVELVQPDSTVAPACGQIRRLDRGSSASCLPACVCCDDG